MEWLSLILSDPTFQAFMINIVAGLTLQGWTKYFETHKNNATIELQLLRCLQMALEDTAERLSWHKSNIKSISETFINSLVTFNGSYSVEALNQILHNSVDRQVTEKETKEFGKAFIDRLGKDQYFELWRNLIGKKLLLEDKTTTDYSEPYILSQTQRRWIDTSIIGRDNFITSICNLMSDEFYC